MDWKTTVMSEGEIMRIGLTTPLSKELFWMDVGIKVAKAQAEISFKAGKEECSKWHDYIYDEGKKAGIKEVVEWVENYYGIKKPLEITIDDKDWKAKLEEWGV